MKKKNKKKHKHDWEDRGLGYFIGSGKKQMFFHDPDAVGVNTHHFVCKCGKEEYVKQSN